MSCAKFNRNHFDTRNPTKLIIVLKKTVPDYNEKCELYYVKFNMCTVMYSVCLFFSTLPTGKKVRKTRIIIQDSDPDCMRLGTKVMAYFKAKSVEPQDRPKRWGWRHAIHKLMDGCNDDLYAMIRDDIMYMKTRWFMMLMHDDRWNDDGINIILMYGKRWYTN